MAPRRYPTLTLAELLDAAGVTQSRMQRDLNVGGQILINARNGGFTLDAADRTAVHYGFHPANVWGDAWWDACEEHERLKAERVERHRGSNRQAWHNRAALERDVRVSHWTWENWRERQRWEAA